MKILKNEGEWKNLDYIINHASIPAIYRVFRTSNGRIISSNDRN